MKVLFILAAIILIINILSLDFDNLFSFKENKNEYINIIVTVLVIIMTYLKGIKIHFKN